MKQVIKNSRVLVTGGAGFIGSNLVDSLLQHENEVVCLDNFITGSKKNIEHCFQNKNFKLIEGDIRNAETCRKAVDGIDYVLHQAALGSVPRSIKDPITTNDVNIGGFVNIITAAKDAKIKRFVFASSSSVYGDSPDLPKVEKIIGKPLSPYAITKLANEIYAKNFSDIFGLETIGLRYFNVFGKRQDPNGPYAAVIPKFILQMIQGERPVIYGDGSISRDFTFVENVIAMNNLAVITNNPEALNKVYNTACGERLTLTELFFTIRDLLAEQLPSLSAIEPIYTSERKGDIKHSLASIELAKKDLEYLPAFKMQDGLKHALAWYLNDAKYFATKDV